MTTQPQQLLTKAVIRILRPLVRVLIRHEMSHAAFSELARRAYVQEAGANFGIAGRKMTHSRIAVLTGLSRKEVRRLVNIDEAEVVEASTPNRAVRVIDGWLSDPEFRDGNKPKVLPLQGETGSFAALVSRYSGDITLGAVVDELERVGVVERPDRDTVVLASPGYIPHADELEKVHVFSICTADLLQTAVHNLDTTPEERRFQRQLTYPNVPASVAEEFRAEAASRSGLLLEDLQNFLATRTADESLDPNAEPVHRVGLGIYFHDKSDVEQAH